VFIATPPHCSSGSFFFKSITIGVPWLCLCSASVSVCQWMDCFWVSVFGVLLWLKLGNAFWWRPALARVRKTGGNRSGSWWNRSGSVHEPVRFPPPNRA
jgi:hypothetical protein